MNMHELIERRKQIKQKFRDAKTVFGTWTSLGDPQITEMFAHSTCDFVGIDIEHGTHSYSECQRIIAAAQAGGSLCFPRIASHNPEMIKRLLDSGADGIIVPMVETAADVEKMVDAIKYSPVGNRSFGMNRAQNYGFDFDGYVRAWNESSVFIVQIESVKGLENLDAILANPNVDGAMLGPYDLSGSLGIPGEIDHPKIKEALAQFAESCKKHGKSCGTQVVEATEATIAEKIKEGSNFIVCASDIFMMWKWAASQKEIYQRFR